MQSLPFSAARAQLSEALRSLEAGDAPMMISRRGQAAGVLMSVAQYRLKAWRDQYLREADASAEADSLAELRQPDAGRDFEW